MIEPAPRKSWTDADPPAWLGLVLWAVLIAVLVGSPFFVSWAVDPWAGVAVAVVAIPAWCYFGPRPMPGFFNGFLVLQGLMLLVAMLVVAVLRAIHAVGVAG